jgi:hypothetical protein
VFRTQASPALRFRLPPGEADLLQDVGVPLSADRSDTDIHGSPVATPRRSGRTRPSAGDDRAACPVLQAEASYRFAMAANALPTTILDTGGRSRNSMVAGGSSPAGRKTPADDLEKLRSARNEWVVV